MPVQDALEPVTLTPRPGLADDHPGHQPATVQHADERVIGQASVQHRLLREARRVVRGAQQHHLGLRLEEAQGTREAERGIMGESPATTAEHQDVVAAHDAANRREVHVEARVGMPVDVEAADHWRYLRSSPPRCRAHAPL